VQNDIIAQPAAVAGLDVGLAPVDDAFIVDARRPRPLGIGDLRVGDDDRAVALDDAATTDQLVGLLGRELVRQLVAEACNVSMCDLAAEGMAETVRLCEAAELPQGLRVTTHIADVSDFAQMERFRAEVADRHATDRIHLLFNNAGIGGGGSLIVNSCEEWERTFNVCWGGVYNCTVLSCRCR
jgi:hypothetical protein